MDKEYGKKMNITVWDDDTDAARRWGRELEDELGSGIFVEAHDAGAIVGELHVLHERRKDYLESGGSGEEGTSVLDGTDVLIVDNDLFDLPGFNDLTAETVAVRAGVYTGCGYIVALNLSPDLDFDLTLVGDIGSKVDLHINDSFVADPGLWKICPNGGTYRPWQWPLLLDAATSYRSRVDDLVSLLSSDEGDRPILKHLGFEEGAVSRLSRSARAFLHPTIPVGDVSFRNFVHGNAKAVSVKDGDRIFESEDVKRMARVAARRIYRWLNRMVVDAQDVLIDLPHLVERVPFVVPEGRRGEVEGWNDFARLCEAPVGLVEDALGAQAADLGGWVDRPVFWSEQLETDETLERVFAARESDTHAQLVFCEDASSFHRSEDCDEFVAAHNSLSDRRFVRWFDDEQREIKYGPQSRFAF